MILHAVLHLMKDRKRLDSHFDLPLLNNKALLVLHAVLYLMKGSKRSDPESPRTKVFKAREQLLYRHFDPANNAFLP